LDGSAADMDGGSKTDGRATASGHSVDLSAVTHRFGNFLAVDDVSLSVRAGEVLARIMHQKQAQVA
jgi:ABC-type uncharacterized transport system ATPase subunit